MTTTFSLEKYLDKVQNKYKITVVASKRARQLAEKSDLNTDSNFKKSSSMALEETLLGKVKYEEPKKKSK
ncbi:MAG: DNA-directed RNA polymerase subunit omega [Candidatus Firestonebacteria bacterium]